MPRTKKRQAPQATLYAYVSKDTRKFLTTLQAKQVGRVSKSTLIEKIFHGLRKKPAILKQLGVTK